MSPIKQQKPSQKRKKGSSNPYLRLVYWSLLIFVSFFLISQSFRSVGLTYQKLGILDLAQKEVDELRLKNIALLQDKEEVSTDDYIETVARNRLNYSREGEIAFIIPEDVLEDPVLDDYLDKYRGYYVIEDDGIQELPDFFDSWVQFFIEGV